MSAAIREPTCDICGQTIAWKIRHCDKCHAHPCDSAICRDVQDLLCAGEHVHDANTCLICGCLDENDCPATDPYVINWSPTVRRRSESVT